MAKMESCRKAKGFKGVLTLNPPTQTQQPGVSAGPAWRQAAKSRKSKSTTPKRAGKVTGKVTGNNLSHHPSAATAFHPLLCFLIICYLRASFVLLGEKEVFYRGDLL